jgi:serpin B
MRKGFLNVAKKRYAAQVAARDFADPATVDAINGWVADNTGGMIRRVISELYPEDRLAIVNALYFDAKWRSPYTKDDVRKRKFTMANGKKRTVNMMFSTEHRYIEGKNARGFVKPYVKGYSYVALLPKKGMGLKKFVSTLDGDAFRALVGSATDAVVHAALPKYSLTYSNDDMADQLKAMGMRTAFSSDADFSKMALDTQGSLMIGDVVHKTKVDVDEEGTRAAAVTAIVMKTSAAPFGNVKTVVLNRPFVYAIVDNATNLPVFIGTVNAPTKA